MKKLKKRFIVPAVVFILGMCALIGAIYVVGESQEQQNRTNAKLNAMTYTERIYGELMEGIGVTDTLKQVVISGDGNINKFYDIAENMMDDSIQSIQSKRSIVSILTKKYLIASRQVLVCDNDLAVFLTKAIDLPENSDPCHPYDLGFLTANIQNNRMV